MIDTPSRGRGKKAASSFVAVVGGPETLKALLNAEKETAPHLQFRTHRTLKPSIGMSYYEIMVGRAMGIVCKVDVLFPNISRNCRDGPHS